MKVINNHIKWIMLFAGALTCSMFYAVIAPEAALMTMFGQSISGPVAEIVVRNWGALIALVGALLIYTAFRPTHRRLVLIVACISKAVFISLVLSFGSQFLDKAAVAVGFDSLVILVFIIHLLSSPE